MISNILENIKTKHQKIYPIYNVYIGYYKKEAQYKNITFTYHQHEFFIGDEKILNAVTKLKCITDPNIETDCDFSSLKKYQNAHITIGDTIWTIKNQGNYTNLHQKFLLTRQDKTPKVSLKQLQDELDQINKYEFEEERENAKLKAKEDNALSKIFSPKQ